jgi:crossover junction endodeoxyribonuclease RusA
MHYELFLPFPPTVNNYYVKTKRGVFISQKGRKYRDEVLKAVLEQAGGDTIDSNMLVEVILFPPDKRKRDVDNYNKALLDALTQAELWEDDSLIDQLFNYRGVTKKGGQVYIRITDAGPIMKDVGMLPMD